VAEERLIGTAKQELLQSLYGSFRELTDALPQADSLMPSPDGWGVFEVVAHLSGWHRFSAGRLRQLAAGQEPISPADEDSMNASFVRERADWTAEALLRDLHDTFRDFVAAVEAVPDAEFWRGPPGADDSLAYFIVNANGPDHYAEHVEDVRSWRG
jgi:uncharacterized protein (TIGR03083 family)